MSSVDDSLAKLSNARYFTRLDANSGFCQISLDSESQLLTTFITPYGRFCFHRLCFGISSAPEIFQSTMNKILEGVPGAICHMDDVFIHGTTMEEHDQRVEEVMERIKRSGMTLNNKCEFSKTSIKFLGFIILTREEFTQILQRSLRYPSSRYRRMSRNYNDFLAW